MAKQISEDGLPAADGEDRPEAASLRPLMGRVEFLVSDEELIEPLFEDWEPHLPGTSGS
jgi:hypothetical protein